MLRPRPQNDTSPDLESDLRSVAKVYRSTFFATGLFSCLINLLMLAGPLFMLQVYDRVLSSQSIPTLVSLLLLVAGLFAIMGALDLIRTRIMARVAIDLTDSVSDRVLDLHLTDPVRNGLNGPAAASMNHLSSIRSFLSGPIPFALFDTLWMPLFILLIFLFHWTLGLVAVAGAIILIVFAIVNERLTRRSTGEVAQLTAEADQIAGNARRNAEVAVALNMVPRIKQQWREAHDNQSVAQLSSTDKSSIFFSSTKSVRLFLQSAILAVGAVLVIQQLISAGVMITASIIMGRALAPIEQSIGQWSVLVRARNAYHSLAEILASHEPVRKAIKLPTPSGHLSVRNLSVGAPSSSEAPIISGISFDVEPGTAVGVIGPSASGKSTLARALAGVWRPSHGAIRLNHATLDQWPEEQRAAALGYLPQDVALFDGTVAVNIARLQPDADDADIVNAAMIAGAHEMVLGLPDGYNTQLGKSGYQLSGGQRQRIGLARALYGNPVLVVLDEPNSNLDGAGDNALSGAINRLKSNGASVIVMAHRPSAIANVDRLLFLDKGRQLVFGEKEEVLRHVQFGNKRDAA